MILTRGLVFALALLAAAQATKASTCELDPSPAGTTGGLIPEDPNSSNIQDFAKFSLPAIASHLGYESELGQRNVIQALQQSGISGRLHHIVLEVDYRPYKPAPQVCRVQVLQPFKTLGRKVIEVKCGQECDER